MVLVFSIFFSSLSILVAFRYSAVGTLMVAMDGSYRIPSISFILSRLCALWYVKPVYLCDLNTLML